MLARCRFFEDLRKRPLDTGRSFPPNRSPLGRIRSVCAVSDELAVGVEVSFFGAALLASSRGILT